MSEVKQTRIAEDEGGIRLDRWFKRHHPTLTHGHLERLLRTGQIRLDGKRAKSSDRIVPGQMMRLPPEIATAPPHEREGPARAPDEQSLRDFVLHMDDSVIVLNKPSGLATQGGSGITKHVDGMLGSLAYGKKQRPRLVHRLDRDTSGVLIVARTIPAAAALAKSLASRDATKIYWALTKGVPKPHQGTVKLALVKEGGRGDERMVAASRDNKEAKHAITDYSVLDRASEEFAWVAAKPVTGRTHQIRVHLASLETPIIGDFKYGGVASRGRGEIEDRLHLHARSIDIPHPDGGRLRIVAPLPPHMAKTWKFLGFDAEAKADFPKRNVEKPEPTREIARQNKEAAKRFHSKKPGRGPVQRRKK